MLEQEYGFEQQQRTQALPRLIEANRLLQLSGQSLDAVITAELQSNPALELTEPPTCLVCGSPLDGNQCPLCSFSTESEPRSYDNDLDALRLMRAGEEEIDQFSYIADSPALADIVQADAFATLQSADHQVAEAIIAAIDDRGWLAVSLKELARMTGKNPGDVERVLQVIQRIAPAGVGARNLAECLRLQVADLRSSGVDTPELIDRLRDQDYRDLAQHRYQNIARRHKTDKDTVAETHEFIRKQLTPNPLQDRTAIHWRHIEATRPVMPDVIVRIIDDEIVVALTETRDARLVINEDYVNLLRQCRRRSATNDGSTCEPAPLINDQERDHIRTSVKSAREFMSRLQQRRRTLLRIATAVCERQEAFLRGSVRDLVPLTRSDIAAEIGVNESTVSRATADKYVMLPNRSVVPFSDFFAASLSVKDVIREIINAEAASGRRVSDQGICDQLTDRGFRIARRTVTKYRLQLDILSSNQRHV